VLDATGKVIYQDNQIKTNLVKLNISDKASDGIYLINIVLENGEVYPRKVVINH
jgi:hypothetical protein